MPPTGRLGSPQDCVSLLTLFTTTRRPGWQTAGPYPRVIEKHGASPAQYPDLDQEES
jgi:hypothetical protein